LEALGFERIPHGGDYKLVGPCPACKAGGGDSKGRHLAIFDDGKFNCIVYPADCPDLGQREEHNQKIWGFLKPILGGKLKALPAPDPAIRAAELAAIAAAKKAFDGAIKKYAGGLDVLGASAPIPADPAEHFATFLGFFRPEDLVWVGERYDSNAALETNIAPASEHLGRGLVARMDHTSGWTWKEKGSRKKTNRAALRLLVVEHDDLSRDEQIALIKFVSLKYRLLAVLDTAGKGFHGLFDAEGKSPVELNRLSQFLSAVGADTGSLTGARTRTPGAIRQADDRNPGGKHQLFVWINPEL
jgi:hypothetical protein